MLKSLSLTVDAHGDVLVAGAFEGSIDFGGRTLTGSGAGPYHFLAKLDGSGQLLWCKSIETVGGASASSTPPESETTGASASTDCGAPLPAADGAFTWMQDSTAPAEPSPVELPSAAREPQRSSAPTAPSRFVPPLQPRFEPASASHQPVQPTAEADPHRDSFEPVWVADDSDGSKTSAALSPAWRTRLGHALGYSLGVAGAASAVGVLALAVMQGPDVEPSSTAPLPAVERSLAAGRFAANVALLESPARPHEPAQAEQPAPANPEAKDGGSSAQSPAKGLVLAGLPPDTIPKGTPGELRSKIVELLTRGQYERALGWARALVVADPHHALSYLCLGAALLDLGRAQEAQQAFSECARRATRGDASECVALGGRK